ncbi:protein of unknown function [Denitratisoma oestradiolicum]|uniref:Uncharacterized protein n=1 Tax=Denitratisoma oestradiolicum TaxID=311182 RepID=A0A6S6XTV5_9PROT|nr:protein of unknown function [Denitratisoma oestradiolicum]
MGHIVSHHRGLTRHLANAGHLSCSSQSITAKPGILYETPKVIQVFCRTEEQTLDG